MKHCIQFDARVIACDYRTTAGDRDYWQLTLQAQGRQIEAFQWVAKGERTVQYAVQKMIRVVGQWTHQGHFRVVYSDPARLAAANDEHYIEAEQMRFDFRAD